MKYLQRLLLAQTFYERRGFRIVDLPWTCSAAATLATGGPYAGERLTSGAYLLGSAEQAFIDLAPKGLCQAITPCFRFKDAHRSAFHQEHFMKLELWSSNPADWDDLMRHAADFFRSYGDVTERVTGTGSSDLEMNGIEVGSYGATSTYAYGTGLAEPRLSLVLEGGK